jgi:hypothetical protein
MAELITVPSLLKRDAYAAGVAVDVTPWSAATTAAAATAPPTRIAVAIPTRVLVELFPYRRSRAIMDASLFRDSFFFPGRHARFVRPGKTVWAYEVLR